MEMNTSLRISKVLLQSLLWGSLLCYTLYVDPLPLPPSPMVSFRIASLFLFLRNFRMSCPEMGPCKSTMLCIRWALLVWRLAFFNSGRFFCVIFFDGVSSFLCALLVELLLIRCWAKPPALIPCSSYFPSLSFYSTF